jgi:hypothetical protein
MLTAAVLLAACGTLSLPLPHSEYAAARVSRIAEANRDLDKLEETDSVIRFNNRWLGGRIAAGLEKEASASGQYRIQSLKVDFSRQYVTVEADIGIADEQGGAIAAAVSGEVLLDVNPYRLQWSAHFENIVVESRDFVFAGVAYADSPAELDSYLLREINSYFSRALHSSGNNSITMNTAPLGRISAGAELPGFTMGSAHGEQALGGVFLNAGSAILVEPAFTTVAMDLLYLPDISHCHVDVNVSRAGFARAIDSREPVGFGSEKRHVDDIRYFFSEISGARQPLTIIHYWYANGKAVALEELEVGVSKRWRTWSSGNPGYAAGDRIEVLIVEKESGCILRSRAVSVPPDNLAVSTTDPGTLRKSFADYASRFERGIEGFSLFETRPSVLAVETRRPAITEALQAALSGVEINADFDLSAMNDLRATAQLQPFEVAEIRCQQRTCPPVAVCGTNISHCKRFRDTRECSSCLFRNPLNNRCVSEAVDPLCEASRNRRNARYDAERAACIKEAELLKNECDLRNAQADRSCKIEAGFADDACEAVKSGIRRLTPGEPLAAIQSRFRASGKLAVNFSNIRIENDLERLKLDIALLSDLQVSGDMAFRPGDIALPLANCISEWSKPFNGRFASTPVVKNLQAELTTSPDVLRADWSGFGMSVTLSPSPLESILVSYPELLANCRIGLTIHKVNKALSGADEGFFGGRVDLELQPLTTRIELDPARLLVDDKILGADAQLSSAHVSYAIEN